MAERKGWGWRRVSVCERKIKLGGRECIYEKGEPVEWIGLGGMMGFRDEYEY